MGAETVRWTYALAPDVAVLPAADAIVLETGAGRTRLDGTEAAAVMLVADGKGADEAGIARRLAAAGGDGPAETAAAALLFRLDRLGLLARTLQGRTGPLVACQPLRAPAGACPHAPPEGRLHLAPQALARAEGGRIVLEAPGAWARIVVHDPGLLALLDALAAGRTAAECAAALPGCDGGEIRAVLALFGWCGLFAAGDAPDWAGHDLIAHVRARLGYARGPLGKLDGAEGANAEERAPADERRWIALDRPDPARLAREDPPFSAVAARRRSMRHHGAEPLRLEELSEFLHRTLAERDGRRPYPSGGSCYPLNGYLAVDRCQGLPPGLYAYDAGRHALAMVAESGPAINRLLDDAAVAAGVRERPQVMLVLAARFGRTRRVYGALAQSLILKETGAVFQTAMLAAAAMGLAACPLGTGNSPAFSALAGLDPLVETSVGELMLGTCADAA